MSNGGTGGEGQPNKQIFLPIATAAMANLDPLATPDDIANWRIGLISAFVTRFEGILVNPRGEVITPKNIPGPEITLLLTREVTQGSEEYKFLESYPGTEDW